MIDFFIFFLGFLANLAVIVSMPDENIRNYINIYNIVGGCSALVFFLLFSNKKFRLHIKSLGYLLIAAIALSYLWVDGFWGAVVIYPVVLVFNDYLATQGGLDKWRNIYRVFLILSVLPFFIFREQFELIFQIRVLLLYVVLLIYTCCIQDVSILKVNSTWKYVLFNYSFYYLPLLIIANLQLSPVALKTWYVFAQGGLVAYLKYLDFALRKSHKVSPHLDRLILFCAMGAPLLPGVWFPCAAGFITYFNRAHQLC